MGYQYTKVLILLSLLTVISCTVEQPSNNNPAQERDATNSSLSAALPTPTTTLVATPAQVTPTPSKSPTPSSIASATLDWREYRNEQLAFSIRYPKDWVVSEQPSSILFINNSGGSSRASLTINVGNAGPVAKTVDELLRAKQETFPGFQSLGSDNFTLAGVEGITVDYTYQDQDNNKFYESVISITAGSNTYSMVLSALKDAYEAELQTFNAMLRTFAPLSPAKT